MSTQPSSLRAIAVITKVFGIRGEVKIHSYIRTLQEYKEMHSVLVGTSEQALRERNIEAATQRSKDVYLKFAGVDDRNASELLVGQYLFVEEHNRKKLPQGSFFIDELIGMQVFDTKNKRLGVVREVLKIAGRTLYSVHTSRGEVLVPVVPEIVLEVHAELKKIVVNPPEGLFSGESV